MLEFINSNSECLQQKINLADVKALEDDYVYQIFYYKGEEVRAYSPVMTIINPKRYMLKLTTQLIFFQ